MYCPDDSCVSTDSTCSRSGAIYTEATGCRASKQCSVGNRGVMIINQNGSMSSGQGSVNNSDSATFYAPARDPCALMVYFPLDMALTFTVNGSKISWYGL
jgi:hypothetical protein